MRENNYELDSEFFLRFAITSNCNFRCEYCNPEGKKQKSGQMTEDEIIQIIRAGKEAGVNRVHWTGGEPTLMDMERLISETNKIGYVDQVLTSNGSTGGDYIRKLADLGLDRMIISLDTLNREKFKKITKRDALDKVLDTIKTSVQVLEQPTKVNIVYMEDTRSELDSLIEFGKEINQYDNKGELIVKLLEITEMNPVFFSENGRKLYEGCHTGKDVMLKELAKYGSLESIDKEVIGNNPNTHYFYIPEAGFKIGMINIPSEGYKCGGVGCSKIRLNPYGKIAVCVNQKPIDIKGKSQDYQANVISGLIKYRSKLDNIMPNRQHKQKDNFGYWRFGDCGGVENAKK